MSNDHQEGLILTHPSTGKVSNKNPNTDKTSQLKSKGAKRLQQALRETGEDWGQRIFNELSKKIARNLKNG